jgi:uncharacterized protein (DUF488 family)
VVATIWTLGHSTRTFDEFLDLLRIHDVQAVADVRRFPGSRRHPQFGQAALHRALADHGLEYRWFEALGGRRTPTPNSPNTAWRNRAFRGYADYMATAEFAAGLAALLDLASERRTAMVCAEAMWWRCHRALIADALCTRGIEVTHIVDARQSVPHPLTSPAQIVQGELKY